MMPSSSSGSLSFADRLLVTLWREEEREEEPRPIPEEGLIVEDDLG